MAILSSMPSTSAPEVVCFGERPLSVEDVVAVALGKKTPVLSAEPAWRARCEASVALLERELARGARVYGVSTGFGDSCEVSIPPAQMHELSTHLFRFHGCGTGRCFDPEEAAAIVAARLACLCRGYSAVRPEVLEHLCRLLAGRILPVMPSEGSVGASGDLTPLSYLAALLAGEREAYCLGRVVEAKAALAQAGLKPLILAPKEALALMNGTSAMTGLGCLAWGRAARQARFAAALTAMAVDALRGQPGPFDERTAALKPHPGQRVAARWIREDLGNYCGPHAESRIQDRYSLRCAPHVIGALLDALSWAHGTLGVELNSVNDNPIVDPELGAILHGGNFYGGHVALAMDTLKSAVASVTELLERQLCLLCHPSTNNGLPANLVPAGPRSAINHGFKAAQIAASALTAEALKLTMPAASFSRSTENHNQDKVSMGTIAARDCLRVVELGETVSVFLLIALAQASELRGERHGRAGELLAAVRTDVALLSEDRRLDRDVARLLERYRLDALPIGGWELVGASPAVG